jgi:DNA-binding FrmR family transcriptional regulator
MQEQVQNKVAHRLAIIRGQVEGLQRMVEDDAYCVDVLTQLSAIHEALRGVGKQIVENHLRTCVTEQLQGESDEREQQYQELMDIIYKLTK